MINEGGGEKTNELLPLLPVPSAPFSAGGAERTVHREEEEEDGADTEEEEDGAGVEGGG